MQNKNLVITLDTITYASRSFVYTADYSDVIRRFGDISIPFSELNYKNKSLRKTFIESFISDHETSIANKIARFDYDSSDIAHKENAIKRCNDSDLSLFLLDTAKIKNSINKKVIIEYFRGELISLINYISKQINHFSYLYKTQNILKNNYLNNLKVDRNDARNTEHLPSLISLLKNIKKAFNDVKRNPTYLFTEHNKDIVYFNNASKIIKKLDDVVDCMEVLSNSICFMALVSKLGAINLIILVDYKSHNKIEMIFDKNGDYKKDVIFTHCLKESQIINSKINKMPKFFSFLDINKLLGYMDSFPIYDDASTDKKDMFYKDEKIDSALMDGTSFDHRTSTFKSIYMRFINNNYHVSMKDSPTLFFNFLSLLVAYGYSLDHQLLWKYALDQNIDKKDHPLINDIINRTTEHLYFNNNLACSCVIDQSVNTHYPIQSKNNNNTLINYNYHQLMIYSFWNFLYACGALSFGSIGLIINDLFINWVKIKVKNAPTKYKLLSIQYAIAIISSRIDTSLNHAIYNSKPDSISIIDAIYEQTGLIRQEKYKKETMDLNWKSGELLNTQKYNRYGLFFSLASLLITIVSFGMIAKVYRNYKVANDNIIDLLFGNYGIVWTNKVYLIILIALIPLAFLLIIYFNENKKFKINYNIPVIAGLRRREKDPKKTKKENKLFTHYHM